MVNWRCEVLAQVRDIPSNSRFHSFRCHAWYMFCLRPLSHPKILLWAIWARHSDSQCYCTRRCPMFPKIPSCLPISWIFVGVSLWYRAIEALEAMQSASTRRCLRCCSNAWERPNLEKEWSTLYLQIPFGMSNSTLNFNSYVKTWMAFFASPAGKCWKPRSFNKRYCLGLASDAQILEGERGCCFLQDASPMSPWKLEYGPPNEVTEVTPRVWRSQPF